MKTTSIISITTALMLCSTSFALGQVATGTVGAGGTGTVVDGAVDLSLDTNADGSVDAEEAAAGVSTDTEVDLSLDTNSDGTVDVEEQAAGDATLDTDGDGTVSEEERAVARQSSMTTEECSTVDFSMMASADDVAAIQSATSAQIVKLDDCVASATIAIDGDVQAAVLGNEVISSMLVGVTGELLGVSVADTSVTVFVSDEDDNEGDGATTAQ